jgi:hypothetical protein
MTLPSFNAEQSVYRGSRHYRSSAFASAVGGIRPSGCTVPPPNGTYNNSCYDCCWDTDANTLTCYCYDDCGNSVYTTQYSVSDCVGCDISNNNGNLGCC